MSFELGSPLPYHTESTGKRKVKTVDSIKTLMENEPTITIPEIAVTLDMSISGIEKAIQRMKSDGLIEREASKKGGRWKVIK